MKHKVILSVVALIVQLFTMQVFGQSYSVGLAGVYGDDIDEPGINFRAYYNFPNDRICFGPEFTYFLSKEEVSNGEELTEELFEINFNGHYIFELSEKLGFYPLSGFNFSSEKETIRVNGIEEEETKRKFGINIGAGFHYAIRDFVVFTEYDHLISDLSQNTYTIGFFYTFGKKEGEGEE